jgi:hypothetical protein
MGRHVTERVNAKAAIVRAAVNSKPFYCAEFAEEVPKRFRPQRGFELALYRAADGLERFSPFVVQLAVDYDAGSSLGDSGITLRKQW